MKSWAKNARRWRRKKRRELESTWPSPGYIVTFDTVFKWANFFLGRLGRLSDSRPIRDREARKI